MKTSWKMSRRTVLGLAAFAMSVATTQFVMAGGSSTRLRTSLSGGAIDGITPKGSADFRVDSPSRTRLEVEVEHLNLPAGTMLDVAIVHSNVATPVGQIKLSALGSGEVELESEKGQLVPAVVKGDMVTVSNAGTGILSGTF